MKATKDRFPKFLHAVGGCLDALTPLTIEERRRALDWVNAELRKLEGGLAG